jgi:hypothetical protein
LTGVLFMVGPTKGKMTPRERLFKTLSGEKADCVPVAPLFEGFAAKELNIPYSSVKWNDQLKVAREIGIDLFLPLCASLPDLVTDAWKREVLCEQEGCLRYRETLDTPVGQLTQVIQETGTGMPWTMEYPIKSRDDFAAFEYVLDWVADIGETTGSVDEAVKEIGEDGVVSAWIDIPLELFGWQERSDTMILAMEDPERMERLCRKIWKGQRKMAESALQKGADVIMRGVPGTELVSPCLFKKHVVPYAREIADIAREAGRWSYMHLCGKIQRLLDQINEIHPAVFETFSPPPEGDTADIGAVRDKIGRDIVAKGNMGLTFLQYAEPGEVYEAGREIIEKAGCERFILSVADVILESHSRRNVEALIQAGHDYKLR